MLYIVKDIWIVGSHLCPRAFLPREAFGVRKPSFAFTLQTLRVEMENALHSNQLRYVFYQPTLLIAPPIYPLSKKTYGKDH